MEWASDGDGAIKANYLDTFLKTLFFKKLKY